MSTIADPFAAARAIADAVLYEGYLLYPYTASARKNRIRWQFGVVVPRAYEAMGTGEHAELQAEALFEAGGAPQLDVAACFLRVETRVLQAYAGDDRFAPVATLDVDGVRHVTFEEGIACEIGCTLAAEPGAVVRTPLDLDAEREIELLHDRRGTLAGRIVRERCALRGTLAIECEAVECDGLRRVRVRIENESDVVAALERSSALRTAFVSCHALLAIRGGAFLSPLDPPPGAAAASAGLRNRHLWPALVGDPAAGAQRAAVVLASPIVVGDFPQIAPQTDTDAFDGTEIDELLTLSVYALSDAERAEARATDPRARALVDRAERFDDAAFERVHAGTFVATEAERSAPDHVVVRGVRLSQGSHVRLAPKRNADAWDMFLAGQLATVRGIQQDFEDRTYVTVTIDDDPASEYHEWYGRSFFFDLDEVEPCEEAR